MYQFRIIKGTNMPQLILINQMFFEWCYLSVCLIQDYNRSYRENRTESLC